MISVDELAAKSGVHAGDAAVLLDQLGHACGAHEPGTY